VQLRIPPPIVALLAAIMMWVLHQWLPVSRWTAPPWTWLGSILCMLGVGIVAIAVAHFRRVRTTINPMQPDGASTLVTDGVFRISRNPMYLGLTLLLVGWAMLLESASPWLVPPVFVAVTTLWQILPEERALGRLFGQPYVAYRQRIPRWIGWPH